MENILDWQKEVLPASLWIVYNTEWTQREAYNCVNDQSAVGNKTDKMDSLLQSFKKAVRV